MGEEIADKQTYRHFWFYSEIPVAIHMKQPLVHTILFDAYF